MNTLEFAIWERAQTSALITDRGWIRPGMRADLLLVKGDPTTDILATRNITGRSCTSELLWR
jgi:imidazolonepropionase-like amidohydrolase